METDNSDGSKRKAAETSFDDHVDSTYVKQRMVGQPMPSATSTPGKLLVNGGPAEMQTLSQVVIGTVLAPETLAMLTPILVQALSPAIQIVVQNSIQNVNIEATIKSSIHEELSSLKSTVVQQADEITKLKTELGQAKAKVLTHEIQIKRLASQTEELEQYSRRNAIRIHNVPIPTDTHTGYLNTDPIVRKLVLDNIGITLSEGDISRSHLCSRVVNGKAQVLVKFTTYNKRREVFQAKSKLKGNPAQLFIVEDLTRFRSELMYELRQLRKANKIAQAWTQDGRIFVRVQPDGQKILINGRDDIAKLMG